jgi:hypothetical protein
MMIATLPTSKEEIRKQNIDASIECIFLGKILQNFDMKNLILTDTKDFSL